MFSREAVCLKKQNDGILRETMIAVSIIGVIAVILIAKTLILKH